MIRFGKSEEEFQALYRTQWGRIRRVLLGMTGNVAIAEELAQESFLKAWKGLPQFGFKSDVRTWLFSVALNVGRDWLRSHKSLPPLQMEEDREGEPETRAIQECLLELDTEARELLVLFYYEGMKIQEMAQVLRVPEGTVKSRLFTAKGKLRDLLLTKGHDV